MTAESFSMLAPPPFSDKFASYKNVYEVWPSEYNCSTPPMIRYVHPKMTRQKKTQTSNSKI